MPHGSAFSLSLLLFFLLLLPFHDISLLYLTRARVAFFLSIALPPGLRPWLTTSPTTPMRCQRKCIIKSTESLQLLITDLGNTTVTLSQNRYNICDTPHLPFVNGQLGRADVRQHECIRPKPRPKPHPEPQSKAAPYSPTTADNSQQQCSSPRSCIQRSPATRIRRSAPTSRTPPIPISRPLPLLQRPLFFSKRASAEPTSQPVPVSVSSSPPPPLPATSKLRFRASASAPPAQQTPALIAASPIARPTAIDSTQR